MKHLERLSHAVTFRRGIIVFCRDGGSGALVNTRSPSRACGHGGHFAAREQPELLTAELRAAFRTLREAQ